MQKGKAKRRTNPPPPALLELLNEEMKRLNWSPYELSKASQVAHPTVYETLAGKSTPNARTLTKIAAALGISDLKLKIAAGVVEPTEATEIDLMLADLRLALLRLPAEQRPTAIAAAKGMIAGMGRAGEKKT